MGEIPTVTAYMKFEFDCPDCGGVTSLESDPAGDDVECDYCGKTVHINETI